MGFPHFLVDCSKAFGSLGSFYMWGHHNATPSASQGPPIDTPPMGSPGSGSGSPPGGGWLLALDLDLDLCI